MDPAPPSLAEQYVTFCNQNGYFITRNEIAEPQNAAINPKLQEQINTIYSIMQSVDNKQLRPYLGFAGTFLSCTTQCMDIKIALFATDLLLNTGIHVNDKVNAKQTALEQIIEFEERKPVVELLLARGAALPTSLRKASLGNAQAILRKSNEQNPGS